jgi:Kef-type K+ transport system, predicted NAD-binding component
MHHNIPLISTIAVALVYGLILGLLAVRLRMPPLIGYLLAGVLVGPFTPGFVADAALAPQLAEIGVILLMFGVGMHFSLKDLLAVRNIALPGAILQITVATLMGVGLARLWGWPLGAGLVFGLALSVASTVVLLRALEARNALDSEGGRIAVGWLIVEDLVMVVVLVLLPALAPALGGKAAQAGDGATAAAAAGGLGMALVVTLGKVAAFVAVMLVAGARALPWLLSRVEDTGSRELFTLCVSAIALGVAYGSGLLFGVSFALGAFFAGIVVNTSDYSRRAARELQPLQDAFSVLFFVSVGMLFDPSILLREPIRVLLVLAVIVVGKSVAALGLVLALRRPPETALLISASLAQIGEFSFILASLGLSLGLLSKEGQSLVLAGSLLSIMLNTPVFALVSRIRQQEQATHEAPDEKPEEVVAAAP